MVNKLSYKLRHFHGLIAGSMEAKQLENDLEAALLERDALKAELKATQSRLHEVAVGCANAEFELEAARKQDPVAWNRYDNDKFVGTVYKLPSGMRNTIQRFDPLYASPVPAQQPAEVTPEYPMQPMFLDKGLPRFEKNPIVDWLCEKHGLNEIGIWWQVNNVEQKYIEQLYQLIGYSISGYEELGNVSDTSFDRAKSMAELLLKGGEND